MPRLAAFAAMAAEAGGPVTSTRELWAAMRAMAESARTDYPNNTLIREIVAEITGDGDDALGTDVAWDPGSENLGAAMLAQALATAPRVRQILASQGTPEETAQYAGWILAIVRAGANAAGRGLFGLGGERLTTAEARFVQELAAALGAA